MNTKIHRIFESAIAKIKVDVPFIYILLFCIMGLIILFIFIHTLPDKKTVTIVFCNVGQGDAIYLNFPNGKDMLIDGGPDGSVLTCIGKYKPFWDRSIDILLLTHPDLDHFAGLISVIERYSIRSFFHTRVINATEEYRTLSRIIKARNIPEHFLVQGDRLDIQGVQFHWLWPSSEIDRQLLVSPTVSDISLSGIDWGLNDVSQIIHLRYGNFDVLFTGDAGLPTSPEYLGMNLSPDGIEVLKVPHHGSKTGLNDEYLQWLKPQYAIISSGKRNRYGHPHPDILSLLTTHNVKTKRTDIEGDIMIQTDGLLYQFR